MGDQLRVMQLEVYHQGCACNVTEKFDGVSMRLASSVHCVKQKGALQGYEIVVEINAPDTKTLDAFLVALQKHPKIRDVQPWGKSGSHTYAILRVKSQSSTYEEVFKQGALHFDSIDMSRGYDIHPIVTPQKRIPKLLSGLEEIGEIHVKRIGTIKPPKGNALSPKQEQALKDALSNGYYTWPRKATLDLLAKKSEVTRRAYQERLRKAESKLLPMLLKRYLYKEAE